MLSGDVVLVSDAALWLSISLSAEADALEVSATRNRFDSGSSPSGERLRFGDTILLIKECRKRTWPTLSHRRDIFKGLYD